MLPEFLRLPPGPPGLALSPSAAPKAFCTRPATGHSEEGAPRPRESPATSPGSADSPPLCSPGTPGTPSPPAQAAEAGGVQTVEGEHVADLTLTGEGHLSSPNSTFLPPPPTPPGSAAPPRPGTNGRDAPAPL